MITTRQHIQSRFTAFTLIELIVVMGILAILATIVIIAVNPARQFAASRNTKRANDVRAIEQALNQHAADNNGILFSGVTTATKIVGTTIGSTYIDLTSILVPNYLSAIPFDPSTGSASDTRYVVYKTANDKIVVDAVGSELNTSISTSKGSAISIVSNTYYVRVPNSTSTTTGFASAITVEAWFKFNALAGGERAIARNEGMFQLGVSGVSSIRTLLLTNGVQGWTSANDITYPFVANKWYHMAFSYEGSRLRTFVDGQKVGDFAATGTIATVATDLGIGANGVGSLAITGTVIDEVRISNVARYSVNFNPSRRLSEDASTRGLWHFDEGSGTTVVDSSGNGNTGTFQTLASWVSE